MAHSAQHTARLVRLLRKSAPRRRVRLPRQQPPGAIEREYASAIVKMSVDIVRRVMKPLMEALPNLLATAARERESALRQDAGEGKKIREMIDAAREELRDAVQPERLESLARAFASRTASYNATQLNRQIRAALGTDVFVSDTGLQPLTESFVDANVGLIKNIGDKLADDIEAATMRAIQEGKLHGELAEELEARFGFAEDRAALIARDQIGKAYGDINAARQRSIGVERFIWRTVNDGRVRPEHEERDGEIYSYDDPPDGELPGSPVNCRCFAEPVLDEILDELEDEWAR